MWAMSRHFKFEYLNIIFIDESTRFAEDNRQSAERDQQIEQGPGYNSISKFLGQVQEGAEVDHRYHQCQPRTQGIVESNQRFQSIRD
jgi:hypothetical protein